MSNEHAIVMGSAAEAYPIHGRTRPLDGVNEFKARDVGVALGYDSEGGNWSRKIRQDWAVYLHEKEHWNWGPHKSIWLTTAGLVIALGLTLHEESSPERRQNVLVILGRLAAFERNIRKEA